MRRSLVLRAELGCACGRLRRFAESSRLAAGAVAEAGCRPRRVPPTSPPLPFFQDARAAAQLSERGGFALRRWNWPVNFAEQPLASISYSRQLVSVTRVREKWPYWSKPLVAAVAVVDQFDEAVQAPVFLVLARNFASSSVGLAPVLGQVARLRTTGSAAREDRARRLRRRRRATSAPRSRLPRTGSACRVASVSDGRRLAEVCEDRRGGVGEALQAAHRRAELAQEGGELAAATLPVRRRVRRSPGRRRRRWRRSRRRGRARARAARGSRSESAASWASWSRWALRMPNRRSTSRSTGLARLTSRLDVVAAAGEAGAEFVEDQAEALRVGQRVDVVDQVGVDAGAVVPSGSRYWPAPGWPSGIFFSGGAGWRAGRPRQGRAAVDELLADQRLRPDLAAGVAAEVLEAGVGDVHHDHRLAGDRLTGLPSS